MYRGFYIDRLRAIHEAFALAEETGGEVNEYDLLLLLLDDIMPPFTDPYAAADFLFSRHGGIFNILCAGRYAFDGYDGVDDETKENMAIIKELYVYLEMSDIRPPLDTDDREKIGHFMSLLFLPDGMEHVYLLPMIGNEMISYELAYVGSFDRVVTDIGHFAELMALYPEARCFAIAHDHIDRLSEPTEQDITVTSHIRIATAELGYELKRHYIFGRDGVSDIPINGFEKEYFNEGAHRHGT